MCDALIVGEYEVDFQEMQQRNVWTNMVCDVRCYTARDRRTQQRKALLIQQAWQERAGLGLNLLSGSALSRVIEYLCGLKRAERGELAWHGESFLRVHWVAVPKALRARHRVNI
eukprot:COSAG01_NODE_5487_length_4230_cov_2.227548_2_plen_114_part_00